MHFFYGLVLTFFILSASSSVQAGDWSYSIGVLNKEIELDGRYTSAFINQGSATFDVAESYNGVAVAVQRVLGKGQIALMVTNFGQDELERDDLSVSYTRPISDNLAISVGAFTTDTTILDALVYANCQGICASDINIESTNSFFQFQYQNALTNDLIFAGKIGYMIGSHDLGGTDAGAYVFSGDADGGAFGLSLIRPTSSGASIIISYEENHLEYEGDVNNNAEESYMGFRISYARPF